MNSDMTHIYFLKYRHRWKARWGGKTSLMSGPWNRPRSTKSLLRRKKKVYILLIIWKIPTTKIP